MVAAASNGFAILSVLLWLCASASAQNSKENSSNKQFFPLTNNTKDCAVPPYQDSAFQPADDMCLEVVDDILNDTEAIQALAEAHAPYLYFHPLEMFTLSSVERTFEDPLAGTIFWNGAELFDDELNQTSLLRSTRDVDYVLFSHTFSFEYTNLTDEYKFGDGFDENGVSNAPIYYHVFDSGNNTITLHYFLYFTWSGPSNLGLVTSYNGDDQYTRMILNPWGVHEGDWESVSVTVCKHKTPSQPLAVTYRQDKHGQQQDCTMGECTFHEDSGTNPVGFVALSTHDVYPISVEDLIFAEVYPFEFWINLQNILMVHRTAYKDSDGAFRRYVPNSTNVVYMPEQVDIPDKVNETLYWNAFGGRWGRSGISSEDLVTEYPVCLTNDTLNFTDCPSEEENPVFLTVMQMLGVNETDSYLIQGASLLLDYLIGSHADSASAPTGPATYSWYNIIGGVRNADVWDRIARNETGADYCAQLSEIPDTYRLPYDVEVVPLVENVIGIVLLCVFFGLVSVCYFVWWKTERLKPILEKDENGRYLPPDIKGRRWIYTKAWLYSFAWSVVMAGAILFFVGYGELQDLLESTFKGIDFSSIEGIFIAVGVFVLIIDTLLLVAVWLRTDDLWLELNEAYYDIVGDDEGMKRFKRKLVLKYNHTRINTFFVVAYSFLLLSLILAVIMVVIGVFSVGFAYSFGYICREIVGALDGVCLRFEMLGMEEVKCGADMHDFCNDWAQKEMVMTMWGAFIVTIGHFFLITAGGMSVLHNRFTKRAIVLLPTREEYANGFTYKLSSSIHSAMLSQAFLEEKEAITEEQPVDGDDDVGKEQPVDGDDDTGKEQPVDGENENEAKEEPAPTSEHPQPEQPGNGLFGDLSGLFGRN